MPRAREMLMLMLGATLYGTTVLIPQFLQTQMGYSAHTAGEVLSPGGFLVLVMMPIVGFLVSRVDARYLIAAGFLVVGFTLFRMTRTAMLWRCYQAAGSDRTAPSGRACVYRHVLDHGRPVPACDRTTVLR